MKTTREATITPEAAVQEGSASEDDALELRSEAAQWLAVMHRRISDSHYSILGLMPDAGDAVLQAAYLDLAQRLTVALQRVDDLPHYKLVALAVGRALQEAIAVLGQPESRAAYNLARGLPRLSRAPSVAPSADVKASGIGLRQPDVVASPPPRVGSSPPEPEVSFGDDDEGARRSTPSHEASGTGESASSRGPSRIPTIQGTAWDRAVEVRVDRGIVSDGPPTRAVVTSDPPAAHVPSRTVVTDDPPLPEVEARSKSTSRPHAERAVPPPRDIARAPVTDPRARPRASDSVPPGTEPLRDDNARRAPAATPTRHDTSTLLPSSREVTLARVRERAGQWDLALALWREAIAASPRNVAVLLAAVNAACEGLIELDAAGEWARMSMRVAPGSASAHAAMGRVQLLRGQVSVARRHVADALALDDRHPLAVDLGRRLKLL